MIMSRATPGPSMRRGTFEEGGRTKEEGEMIRGMWSEECGVRIPQISVARWRGGAGVRWRGGARNATEVSLPRCYDD